MTGGASEREGAPPDPEPDVPPTQDHKDHMLTRTLLVRWAPETRAALVMDFIAEKRLFGELNTFLKRRTR